jgi:uncharacterized alpha-E superfamily protein
MQSVGISKDTWVLADGPVNAFSLFQDRSVVLRPARPPGGVPSRVADHLFWLGRYAERLEQSVRILRVLLKRYTGEGSDMETRELPMCREWISHLTLAPARLMQLEGSTAVLAELKELLTRTNREGSIPRLLGLLRYNAAAARDRLSDDTWRLLNRLEQDTRIPDGPLVVSTTMGVLDTLVLNLAAFAGMQLENMTRGHGWRFLEIGRRVERTLAMLEFCGEAARLAEKDDAILTPLLEVADSTMTYRRLHFSRPSLLPVMDLLLLNETNPRSVNYQLLSLARQSTQLPYVGNSQQAGIEKAASDSLLATLHSLNLQAFNTSGREETGEVIAQFCAELSKSVEKLSDLITEHFFSHSNRRNG